MSLLGGNTGATPETLTAERRGGNGLSRGAMTAKHQHKQIALRNMTIIDLSNWRYSCLPCGETAAL